MARTGRTAGSKNRPGHGAGGARAGSGRPSKEVAAQREEERQQKAAQEAARKAAEREKRQKQQERERKQRQVRIERIQKQAMSQIRRSARLQQQHDNDVLCRQGEYGDDVVDDNNEDDSDPGDDELEEDEDNDDESDDEDDYGTEEGGDDATKERRTRRSNKYMPPPGSPLGVELEKFQGMIADMSKGGKITGNKKKMWYMSEDPAAASGSIRTPNSWYTYRRIFVWMPTMQFPQLVRWADMECPFGCDNPGVESKGLIWRPMFNFGDIDWVLHQRVHCKNCRRKCSSIHPDFLAVLPTRIVERLPFVTLPSGPGMHRDMIFQLNSLMGKQILWGSFASSINELQRIKYDEARINFLDTAAETAPSEIASQSFQLDPLSAFSDFYEAGHWNGIKLTVAMVKAAHHQYTKAKEQYMQKRFQLAYDEGITSDHSHKLAKVTRASGRRGGLFGASYTVASHQGLVNINLFTMTKSNAEIEPAIIEYKGERDRQGKMLKRHETDFIGGDGILMKRIFKRDLADGVTPPTVANPSYPVATVARDSISYANTKSSIENLCLALMSKLRDEGHPTVVIGLDCEWEKGEETTYVLSLYLRGSRPVVFDLYNAGILDERDVPSAMKQLLERKNIISTGRNVHVDTARLAKLGINVKEWQELRGLALACDPSLESTALVKLAERFLGVTLDKAGQLADYSQNPLPDWLVRYSAIDAVVSHDINWAIKKESPTAHVALLEAPDGLKAGNSVQLFVRGKVVALAVVDFVGGHGNVKKWGKMSVGSKRAIVTLTEVCDGAACTKPPFSYQDAENDDASWDRNDTSLGDIMAKSNKSLAVNTASLLLPLGIAGGDESTGSGILEWIVQDDDAGDVGGTDGDGGVDNELIEADNNTLGANDANDDADSDVAVPEEVQAMLENSSLLEVVDGDADDIEGISSRSKEDIFHRFQDNPLKKDCPIRPVVSELLIHATFLMHEDDKEKLEKVLEERGVKSDEALLDHFYHNREYWRQRVRMFTPSAKDHAERIRSVHEVVKSDGEMKKYYSNELRRYFEDLEEKAARGYFEEIHDVIMYRRVSKDKDGLPLYIRFRGTVRCENIHQKMKVAIGPWGVGAQTAHFLLVILCHRYNVKSGVRRCGHHDFGHCELDLIDRIQNRYRELYGVTIYPRHENGLDFLGNENMISVGIGPLSYSDQYVKKGEPHPNLKGDLKFLASQMNLELPPLPVASRKEIKIFTEHMIQCSGKPKESDFVALAQKYLIEADGIEVFPKLPTMVRSYFNRWKKNQMIKAAKDSVGPEAKSLLLRLSGSTSAPEHHYCGEAIQAEESRTNGAQDVGDADAESSQGQMFVPPVAAAGQKSYKPATVIRSSKRCAWAPFCNLTIDECGGSRKSKCRFKDNFNSVTPEQLANEKTAMRNNEKRERIARQRQDKN